MKFAKIPMATINRLSIYTRTLEELLEEEVDVISSERLAKQCAVNPAQIRKDLAYFGEFGVQRSRLLCCRPAQPNQRNPLPESSLELGYGGCWESGVSIDQAC